MEVWSPSTALRLYIFRAQALFAEPPPLLAGMRPSVRRQMPLVGALIRQFAKQRQNEPKQAPHNSSV